MISHSIVESIFDLENEIGRDILISADKSLDQLRRMLVKELHRRGEVDIYGEHMKEIWQKNQSVINTDFNRFRLNSKVQLEFKHLAEFENKTSKVEKQNPFENNQTEVQVNM